MGFSLNVFTDLVLTQLKVTFIWSHNDILSPNIPTTPNYSVFNFSLHLHINCETADESSHTFF